MRGKESIKRNVKRKVAEEFRGRKHLGGFCRVASKRTSQTWQTIIFELENVDDSKVNFFYYNCYFQF